MKKTIGEYVLGLLMIIIGLLIFGYKKIFSNPVTYLCPHGKKNTNIWNILSMCYICRAKFIDTTEIKKKVKEDVYLKRYKAECINRFNKNI